MIKFPNEHTMYEIFYVKKSVFFYLRYPGGPLWAVGLGLVNTLLLHTNGQNQTWSSSRLMCSAVFKTERLTWPQAQSLLATQDKLGYITFVVCISFRQLQNNYKQMINIINTPSITDAGTLCQTLAADVFPVLNSPVWRLTKYRSIATRVQSVQMTSEHRQTEPRKVA